ncbi:hypothetical protein PG985_002077 [Apiospora marii]|uniref:Uncharacterized protein n=1 Tax=Apiospora marii TaxID=335849 RepID=A0ABR1RYI6_9PEZI
MPATRRLVAGLKIPDLHQPECRHFPELRVRQPRMIRVPSWPISERPIVLADLRPCVERYLKGWAPILPSQLSARSTTSNHTNTALRTGIVANGSARGSDWSHFLEFSFDGWSPMGECPWLMWEFVTTTTKLVRCQQLAPKVNPEASSRFIQMGDFTEATVQASH